MKPSIRNLLLLPLTLAAWGTSCGGGETPPYTPPVHAPRPAEKKEKTIEKVEIAPTADLEYRYDPINKRDPFRGLMEVGEPKKKEGDLQPACTEPLCLVDLDDLTVVGIVIGDASPLAMVEDRAGVGHLVRRNTQIGKQGGKVTQILRDCIVVTSFATGGDDRRPQANKQNLCVKTDSRSSPVLDLLTGKEFTQ